MRYQEYFKSTNDSELYRLELIESLGHTLPLIKKQAEQALGRKIRSVTPSGKVNDPVHFDEGIDVEVVFYLDGMENARENSVLSDLLREYFADHPFHDIGTIRPIVLQRI
jgi:hypothetical protein